MKKQEDILSKAADALAQTPVSAGPPQQTVDATLAKLTELSGSAPPVTGQKQIWILERLKAAKGLPRLAAAAVLLIAAGYLAGRLSAPGSPDIQQLRSALEPSLKSSLEPAIHEQLLGEMKQYWQLSLVTTYARLKDQLDQQYRQDLNQFAAQTLAASTTVTNHLLEDLITAINAAQMQDRRWVAAALQQIESNRLHDKTQLSNGLATLAVYTDDQLLKTKNDIAQFLSNTVTPDLSQTPNQSDRKE
ncbi:MAG: hypothetical protein NTX52_15020 [Planctomycetota bacterium]|nr:hypothetical protein [Planctomycetota bacterium]